MKEIFEAVELVYYLYERVLNAVLGIGAVAQYVVRGKVHIFLVSVEYLLHEFPVVVILDRHNDRHHVASPPSPHIIPLHARLVKKYFIEN